MSYDPQGTGSTTPFPNNLIDKVMPLLSDTALRLLVVIVRQTLGYRSIDGTAKGSDWLSHSQLKLKTGRTSSAISEAIDALSQGGLIRVTDRLNRELATRQARQSYRGRLYFGLTDLRSERLDKVLTQLSRIRSSKTTKETHTKRESVISDIKKQGPQKPIEGLADRASQSTWHRVGKLIEPVS